MDLSRGLGDVYKRQLFILLSNLKRASVLRRSFHRHVCVLI
jgi:hypothetical protein